MKDNTVHILWDNSHLWGVMALRAMRAFGVNCSLVKSKQIAQGGVLRKGYGMLLAPGGSARRKAGALGVKGREILRQWVASGGIYLGFCGGAGLALSDNGYGLGLCPWQRQPFPDRLYHLISGNLLARAGNDILPLPVWWPGRFAWRDCPEVEILARYHAPGPDLWLADLPLAHIPPDILSAWGAAGSLDQALDFSPGQPLVIEGKYGHGKYILSYAHLETPAAPKANAWLWRLLAENGLDLPAGGGEAPQWRIEPDNNENISGLGGIFAQMLARVWNLALIAEKNGYFFRRSTWLWGWRRGMPGMPCNNLLACLAMLGDCGAAKGERQYWQKRHREFIALFELFLKRAEAFFWNFRLAETLKNTRLQTTLQKERDDIFGHPMLGGGMLEKILATLEDLVFLCQQNSKGA